MYKCSCTSDKSGARFQETADIFPIYQMSDQSQANTGTNRPLPETNSDVEEDTRELSSRLPKHGELATGRSSKRIRGLPFWYTPRSPGTHPRYNNNDGLSSESGSTSTARCNPGAHSTDTTEEASPFDAPMHLASSFTSGSDTVSSLVPTVPPTSLGLATQDGIEESLSSQDAVQASNNSTPEELVCLKVGVATPDDLVCPFIHLFRDRRYQ